MDELFPPGTVTVLHRRGVVDNENTSIVSMCELLGLRARAGKVARCYQSSSPRLREVIKRSLSTTPSKRSTTVPLISTH